MEENSNRYVRQIMIDGWHDAGQKRLAEATVCIAGAGGLGSPVALYLAGAGVGHLVICDMDQVDLTNLNRQILHKTSRIGMNKSISAKKTIYELNDSVSVTAIQEKIHEDNIHQIMEGVDIIVDCLDNFETRYLLMKEAIARCIPIVYGSVWGMEGRLSFIQAPQTPCLKCIFPDAPQKETFPIVGATAGVIGSLQALETIKYITQTGELLKSKLLVWDGTNNTFHNFKIRKDINCPICNCK